MCNLLETQQGGPWCGQFLGEFARQVAGRSVSPTKQQNGGFVIAAPKEFLGKNAPYKKFLQSQLPT